MRSGSITGFRSAFGTSKICWRAVDANGHVLDALLQTRRNKRAALRLMRKLLKGQGISPRVMVTDTLRILRCSEDGTDAGRRASISQGHQQSSREFTSSRATTGAAYDAFQLGPAMPAFRLSPWPDRQSFSTSSQTTLCRRSSKTSLPRHRNMARHRPVDQHMKDGLREEVRPVLD